MTKSLQYLSLLIILIAPNFLSAQFTTVNITPQNEQWGEKHVVQSGGTYYVSGNSNADETGFNNPSDVYEHIRLYFNHPGFQNSDIAEIVLTVTYKDLDISSGSSIANVVAPDANLNQSTPWTGFLSSQEEEDLFNSVEWGDIIFSGGIGTSTTTSSTTTSILIYDQAASGLPSTTINYFDPNSENFTIGFKGAVGRLEIENVSATVTYDCGPVGTAPNNLTASGITSTSANLSWNSVPGATSYDIFRDGNSIGTSTTTSFTASLNPNTSYDFQVRGNNSCGPGPLSSVVTAHTCLPAPSNLTSWGATSTSANLSWSGSGSFSVLVNGVVVGNTNNTNFSLSNLTPGSTNTVQVIRTGPPCNSDPATINVTVIPEDPSGLVADAISPSQISLTWPSVPGATVYKIYDCNSSSFVTSSGTNSITIGSLTSNTSYSYKITAVNSAGESGFSSCASALTLLHTPVITAVAVSSSEIQVDWPAITAADEYEIYDCSNVYITTTSSNSFTQSGLTQATQYFYKVKAVSSTNESLLSGCETTITLPETPSGLTANGISENSILLEWTSTVGSSGQIEVANGAGTIIGTTTGNSFTVNALNPNTNYSFKIRQATPLAVSAFTPTVSAYTLIPTPLNVQSSPLSTSEVQLSWDAVSGADYYEVYDCAGAFISSSGPGDLSMVIGGMSEATLYKYKVKAKNNNTESLFSSCANSFTKLTIPTSITVNAISSSEAEVSWAPVASATSYNVYDCNGSFVGNTLSSPFTVTGLQANTSNSFKVSATYISPLLPPSGGINGHAFSDFSVCDSDVTWLSAPVGLSTTTVSTSEIDLSWSAVPGATQYVVEDCNGGWITTTASLSTTIGSLNAGTIYEFKVKAENATNQSDWSNCISGMTGLETPILSVTGSTANTISLSWTPITGATGYLLEYCSSTFIASTTASVTTYTVTGLSPQTTYEFKVKAIFNGSGGGSIGGSNSSPFSSCVDGATTQITQNPRKNLESHAVVECIVYPNPFTDVLSIEGDNINAVYILDLSGKLVYSHELDQPLNAVHIDPALSNGAYFVVVQTEDGEEFRTKIIKH